MISTEGLQPCFGMCVIENVWLRIKNGLKVIKDIIRQLYRNDVLLRMGFN
jgi:hypothetical protein